MSKNKFVRKYKWILMILILIPIIAIGLFAVLEYRYHKIDMKAGEWASFIGAILGYLGTVFLGTLAFWQNEKAYEKNSEAEKRSLSIEHSPLLIFNNIEYVFYNESIGENDIITNERIPVHDFNGNKIIWKTTSSKEKKIIQLKLHFKNIGNALACNIYAETKNGKIKELCNILDSNNNPTQYVLNDYSGIVLLNIKLDTLEKTKKEEYIINYSNPFGSQYFQTIIIRQGFQDKIIEVQTLIEVKIKPES